MNFNLQVPARAIKAVKIKMIANPEMGNEEKASLISLKPTLEVASPKIAKPIIKDNEKRKSFRIIMYYIDLRSIYQNFRFAIARFS